MKKILFITITVATIIFLSSQCLASEQPLQHQGFITLQSNDGQASFDLPIEIAQLSITLKNLIEDVPNETVIELPWPSQILGSVNQII